MCIRDRDQIGKYEEQIGEHVLYGLPKGKYGFLISTPDTGKSYCCLSLAYEIASGTKIMGLAASSEPKRVLYWPVEDGTAVTMGRIAKHLKHFSRDVIKSVTNNLKIYESQEYLCTPLQDSSYASERFLDGFADLAKGYDLVIIDTVREATGACHEVKDDKVIKLALKRLTDRSNAAVLVTHHLTKDASRGNEPITSISGSGLSETLANSRYQIMIQKKQKKRGWGEDYFISHIKKNYVPREYVLVDKTFNWTDCSLPYVFHPHTIDEEQGSRAIEYSVEDSLVEVDMTVEPVEDYPEAGSIDMDSAVVSSESKIKADKRREEMSIIKKKDIDGLRAFKEGRDKKKRS